MALLAHSGETSASPSGPASAAVKASTARPASATVEPSTDEQSAATHAATPGVGADSPELQAPQRNNAVGTSSAPASCFISVAWSTTRTTRLRHVLPAPFCFQRTRSCHPLIVGSVPRTSRGRVVGLDGPEHPRDLTHALNIAPLRLTPRSRATPLPRRGCAPRSRGCERGPWPLVRSLRRQAFARPRRVGSRRERSGRLLKGHGGRRGPPSSSTKSAAPAAGSGGGSSASAAEKRTPPGADHNLVRSSAGTAPPTPRPTLSPNA